MAKKIINLLCNSKKDTSRDTVSAALRAVCQWHHCCSLRLFLLITCSWEWPQVQWQENHTGLICSFCKGSTPSSIFLHPLLMHCWNIIKKSEVSDINWCNETIATSITSSFVGQSLFFPQEVLHRVIRCVGLSATESTKSCRCCSDASNNLGFQWVNKKPKCPKYLKNLNIKVFQGIQGNQGEQDRSRAISHGCQ